MPRKNIIIIASAVAGILLLGGVVGTLLQKPKTDTSTQKQTEQQNEDLLGEAYANEKLGVDMRLPKGWKIITSPNPTPNGPMVEFGATTADTENGHSFKPYGALNVTSSKGEDGNAITVMEKHVRPFIEAAVEAGIKLKDQSKLVHKTVHIGDRSLRFIAYELPTPEGFNAYVARYALYKDGKFYDFNYITLISAWPKHQPAIEASIQSLK